MTNFIYLLVGFTLVLAVIGAFLYFRVNNPKNIDTPIEQSNKPSEVEVKPADQVAVREEEKEVQITEEQAKGSIAGDPDKEKASLMTQKETTNPGDKTREFNMLVLGIDRRTGEQKSWRTDVIQLVTVNKDRNKVVMTHIPRDIWAGKYKINAVYNLEGADAIKDAVQSITGFRADRIARVDFDGVVEFIDALNGVTVDVEKSFTDIEYPADRLGKDGYITVKFEKGVHVLKGEDALIYSRSRHGDNGSGTDYDRGHRQQLIMKSIVADLFKPGTLFEPKTAEKLYQIVTKNIYTDISIADAKVMWDLVQNYKTVQTKYLSLDSNNFLMVGDKSKYGGQWVLVQKTGDSSAINAEIKKLLEE